MTNFCGNCKHFKKVEDHSLCDNADQTDGSLKQYVYHSFSCMLFSEGTHETMARKIEVSAHRRNETN